MHPCTTPNKNTPLPMSELNFRKCECRVFLIRHAETVDNIKGLYAGTKDSALTSHGVHQADRLGAHFFRLGIIFTHLFSSDLSRALKTAQSIQTHQPNTDTVKFLTSQDLREQDFGYLEGQPCNSRASGSISNAQNANNDEGTQRSSRNGVESKESLTLRAERVLPRYLFSVLETNDTEKPPTVAIVSHGMLLGALWRCILAHQHPGSVSVAPEVTANDGPISLERLGGWSNTGYIEMSYRAGFSKSCGDCEPAEMPSKKLPWSLHITGVNKRDHLLRLKRTRGGVGSAEHDEAQKSIDSFFKRHKKS